MSQMLSAKMPDLAPTLSLEPLLKPRSIAIVGASEREGSFSLGVIQQLLKGGYAGDIHLVNPKRDRVLGMPCVPSLKDIGAVPDHAVMVVPNDKIEEQIDLAIARGIKAATILASCYLADDTDPPLTERIREKALAGGLALCGGSSSGMLNPAAKTCIGWYDFGELQPGPIGLITHSGGLFITFCADDPRMKYNLAVSPGQELVVSMADYMHYMLDQPDIRTIALFMETVRNPDRFLSALERAQAQKVPVVALKVGRTSESARLAKTHSGALTGDDDSYQAVFEQFGVQRVHTVDELSATALMLSQPRRFVQGGVGAVMDSGGVRGMVIDLADDFGLPFADINAGTKTRLSKWLDHALEPVNPVDAWGSGDFTQIFKECLLAVADDPDTAVTLMFTNVGLDLPINRDFLHMATEAYAATDKPFALVFNWSRVPNPEVLQIPIQAGVPVIDGAQNGLLAAGHALRYRDFLARPVVERKITVDGDIVARWRQRLAEGNIDERTGMELLADFGMPTPATRVVESATEAGDAAEAIGYPVVLKTAMEGIHHKSDVGGVVLNLADRQAVEAAWQDLATRLGPRAIVQRMLGKGVEVSFGMVWDDQFGPMISIGAGGVLIELLRDRKVVRPPIDANAARRAIDQLKMRPVFNGLRGQPAVDIDALANAFAQFAQIALCLGDVIAELDINPLIVGPEGCVAADVLILPKQS